MENNNITIVLTVCNLIILAVTAWASFRRSAFQNTVDDSSAALNYRKIVVDLQTEVKDAKTEVKEAKKEVDDLRRIMEQSHLEVQMVIEVGGAPVIKHWKWREVEITDGEKTTK